MLANSNLPRPTIKKYRFEFWDNSKTLFLIKLTLKENSIAWKSIINSFS
ncbi:hypothetical protein SynROS8604_00467 [Synechococcus sp. ROS8604]|nr:hypothetical protein SynROS8604_00467 [Synechococcus sp. ROS8604]